MMTTQEYTCLCVRQRHAKDDEYSHPLVVGCDGGFTLIEVLVTMFVVAVGVLGIMALQLKGIQYNQDSQIRTQASAIASDIMFRIENDKKIAKDFDSAFNNWTPPPGEVKGCNQKQKSTNIICIRSAIAENMPLGSKVDISVDNNTNIYTILFTWDGRDGALQTAKYQFFMTPLI